MLRNVSGSIRRKLTAIAPDDAKSRGHTNQIRWFFFAPPSALSCSRQGRWALGVTFLKWLAAIFAGTHAETLSVLF